MKGNRVFYILGGISIFIISISSILLITKGVVGFDDEGFSARDCVPYNIFVSRGEKNYSVDITWSTKKECFGFVQYGKERSSLDMVGIDIVNRSKSRDHIVNIDGLLSDDVYYFLINSQEQAYGKSGVPLEFVLKDL